MEIIFPETVKRYVSLQLNSDFQQYSESGVFDLMYPHIKNLNPQNVLELGCGIGRGSVHFFKKFNWSNVKFYLLDGDSGNKQISGLNPNTSEDFYNSITATEDFCVANGLTNFKLINIEKEKIPNIQFDLVYSLASIGFHWSVDLYLDKLVHKLKSGTFLVFETRSGNNTNKNCHEWVDNEIQTITSHPNYELCSYDKTYKHGVLAIRRT